MTKSNKIMVGAIAILAVGLMVQTGYIIGTNKKINNLTKEAEARETSRNVLKYDSSKANRTPSQHYQRFAGDPFFSKGLGSWDPFEEMSRMQSTMNNVFNNAFGQAKHHGFLNASSMGQSYQPDLDIREKDDHYLVELDLPGIEKDKIDIKVHDHALTISGERVSESNESDENQGHYRLERSVGSFLRTIPLPEDIDRSRVEAEIVDGVLSINLPKRSGDNPGNKVIPVEVK